MARPRRYNVKWRVFDPGTNEEYFDYVRTAQTDDLSEGLPRKLFTRAAAIEKAQKLLNDPNTLEVCVALDPGK